MDNVYPVDRDNEGRFGPLGGCAVLINTDADVPVQIRSVSVRDAKQVRISDDPCELAGLEVWDSYGLTPPVKTCVSGTVLEPKSASPRHGCSLRIVRDAGLEGGAVPLDVDVTATCTSPSPRPCSLLGEPYAPSSQHPVTAIVTTTRALTFIADSSVSGGTATGDTGTTGGDTDGGTTGDTGGFLEGTGG